MNAREDRVPREMRKGRKERRLAVRAALRADGSARKPCSILECRLPVQGGVSHRIPPASARTNGLDLIPTLMPRQATVTPFCTYKPPRSLLRISVLSWCEGGERKKRERRPRGVGAIEWNDRFACNDSPFLFFFLFFYSFYRRETENTPRVSSLAYNYPIIFSITSQVQVLEDKAVWDTRSRSETSEKARSIDLTARASERATAREKRSDLANRPCGLFALPSSRVESTCRELFSFQALETTPLYLRVCLTSEKFRLPCSNDETSSILKWTRRKVVGLSLQDR